MKKKISIAVGALTILLIILNPSSQSFKEFLSVQLSYQPGIEKKLSEKYLVSSRVSNLLIFSVYQFSYNGPTKIDASGGRYRNRDGSRYSSDSEREIDPKFIVGKYIGIFGNFFKL